MQFHKVPPDENFPYAKFLSENQVWELGVRPMAFGFRVCGNRVGSQFYAFDYCAGADLIFLNNLFFILQAIFKGLDESITERQLQNLLPSYEVKPISGDPCWQKLQDLAISLNSPTTPPCIESPPASPLIT